MKKNLNIQGLRAIFAMMVFLGHAFGALKTSWYEPLYHTPVHLFWDGAISVVCFFVLSGWFYYNVGGEYNFICPFVNEENIQNSSALLDSAIVWCVALGNVRSLWRGTL